jgi:ABC-2 type transport system ATP-binding protein
MQALQALLVQMPDINKVQLTNGCLQLSCQPEVQAYDVNKYCVDKGIVLGHLVLKKKSLETKFMELTN